MNLYPALVATMGSWRYYIVKMKMREVATEVRFANEVYEDRTLDEAIQRDLKEGRVRKEIVSFLSRRPDRFFASLVVAAIGGNPQFFAVQISDEPQFAIFSGQGLDKAFGVLTFSGDQKYYALDGQHRLAAIKTLLDRTDELSSGCPAGFEDEEISVLIVIKREEPVNEFMKSYRRLFSSLNRYAKPTNADTNIIMDEDDTFAILTRRLISEHRFFQWAGRDRESPRIKTQGKNLKEGETFFTSLQTLYAMNKELLKAAWRELEGWGNKNGEGEKDITQFIRFRPDEDYLDSLYAELVCYWDAVLSVCPDLDTDPGKRRGHSAEPEDETSVIDDLRFWPIGQELFIKVVRTLLDRRLAPEAVRQPTAAQVERAIRPLRAVDWELHRAPWRHLLLIKSDPGWKMRSEDRKPVTETGLLVARWIVGVDDLSEEEVIELQKRWANWLLSPDLEPSEMWEAVVRQCKAASV